MEIKEAYVSFELAKLLKEKGFDIATEYVYLGDNKGKVAQSFTSHFVKKRSDILPCPTHQLAMAWLREVHNLHCDIDPSEGDWKPNIIELENWSCVDDGSIPICDTYEEAVEAALKYALENLI